MVKKKVTADLYNTVLSVFPIKNHKSTLLAMTNNYFVKNFKTVGSVNFRSEWMNEATFQCQSDGSLHCARQSRRWSVFISRSLSRLLLLNLSRSNLSKVQCIFCAFVVMDCHELSGKLTGNRIRMVEKFIEQVNIKGQLLWTLCLRIDFKLVVGAMDIVTSSLAISAITFLSAPRNNQFLLFSSCFWYQDHTQKRLWHCSHMLFCRSLPVCQLLQVQGRGRSVKIQLFSIPKTVSFSVPATPNIPTIERWMRRN